MSKEKNVIKYYITCNKLKDVIRTGWKEWNVKKDRLESVAEHIYGTQMLALAIKSEYNYDIDIMKVIYMLAIHEIGESIIGDITRFEMSKEEKEKIEHDAVHEILNGLVDGEEIEKIFIEFDAHETKEAKFAYQVDKLECDLQCKLYDEAGLVDIHDQKNNITVGDERVKKVLDSGKPWSTLWLEYWQEFAPYDDNFKAISNYAKNNKISKET